MDKMSKEKSNKTPKMSKKLWVVAIILGIVMSCAIIGLVQWFIPLNPARGLTGTWKSSIRGEGLVLEPKYNPPHRFHYDVQLELTQSGNKITGKFWTMLWKVDQLGSVEFPPLDYVWLGSYPVSGQISSSHIEFTVSVSDVILHINPTTGETTEETVGVMVYELDGRFTTHLMSGQVEAYQYSLKMWYVGNFTLIRC
jgi:hypothetical protein